MSALLRSVLALGLCSAVEAALPPGTVPPGTVPPLIDRDLFFGEVQISGAQVSPDGMYISF